MVTGRERSRALFRGEGRVGEEILREAPGELQGALHQGGEDRDGGVRKSGAQREGCSTVR